ncbi:3-oxoacyl-ACP reductase FabG [Ferrovum myxofaciens]|jgi:3-oxoacyl-[acyl-carrier protein] reductase|uniref:3-oxoacyl-[acyl-carrier-protein] reductase n=2 Tax=root TaxID=1 RepID=A0A8F3DUG7_9PROT|nr:3-oxoacyl-ACP reductase FabG [Ferrovum myxofaciens]MBW8029057.1 3-oxoacyl-ACP reductase FabG [Ferrovum sp.]KXW59282.1 3-oxoacyl-[acyl-carrier-protein] reductase FabG [Ferrovum myxofaciens]MBU6993652.1 3-oxoacyl-ACP reductase FabG [Ferrovum myxofaciens]NDU89458.1 3-oxoacyl-ACP reductase FabG [Ferrovum sp.]QKE37644.1 MAG: 3-oxoacyl-ACP reductase FabG [Ferrovum myxofaciens]
MLKEQVVLVTGASRGIGQAIARELARQGAKVAATATTVQGAEQIEKDLHAIHPECLGLVLDVRVPEAILQTVDAVKQHLGPISILVNNAGVTRDMLAVRMRDEEWDTVLDTNLKAVFQLSRAVLRDMMKARQGRIINIGSVVGSTGNGGQANYAAAKAGLVGLTKSLARELGSRGITVNCVAPGFIDTDMTRGLDIVQQQALLSSIPLGRLGQPEDIAQAVAYLASPGAAYVTGATLHVNGGMVMD